MASDDRDELLDDAPARPTLTPRGTVRISREQQARLDLEKLWPHPEFKRFLFTLFQASGMYRGIYSPEDGSLAYCEGRRSLGFTALRLVEDLDPAAHAIVLTEEAKIQQEAPSGRRKPYDRTAELDDGGASRRREPVDGSAAVLDYGRPVEG